MSLKFSITKCRVTPQTFSKNLILTFDIFCDKILVKSTFLWIFVEVFFEEYTWEFFLRLTLEIQFFANLKEWHSFGFFESELPATTHNHHRLLYAVKKLTGEVTLCVHSVIHTYTCFHQLLGARSTQKLVEIHNNQEICLLVKNVLEMAGFELKTSCAVIQCHNH